MTAAFEAAVAGAGLSAHWLWRVEVRSRRRTLGLDVLPDGSILIAVPAGADPSEVRETVRARRLWLARAMQRRAAVAAKHPAKEIVDGEGFGYLGRHYRLLLVDQLKVPAVLHGGWLKLRSPGSASAIIDWYRTRGHRWLTSRVTAWSGRIGVPDHPPVEVGDLGTRWGMRNPDGSVNFHWAVMQLEPELVDLVVVHELIHLLASRHDKEFRRRLLLAIPDAPERENRLVCEGRSVWMGAVR